MAAFESLVQAGLPIPDGMSKYIPNVLAYIDEWGSSGDAGYVARLERVMGAQPEGFRSSEYCRVFSEFRDGPEHCCSATGCGGGLQECGRKVLVGPRANTRAYEEAWTIYVGMATNNERGAWCDPHQELLEAEKARR